MAGEIHGNTGNLSPRKPVAQPKAKMVDERQAAERLSYTKGEDEKDSFRHVVRAGLPSNSSSPELRKKIELLLHANLLAEKSEMANLTLAQRADYQAISSIAAKTPAARLALQLLLHEGKLTNSRALGGENLLENLSDIRTQPLAPGIDRAQLMGQLIREIAYPSTISQEDR
ncbi:MAG TPA: hypothetical protein V6C82_07185, partial [Chroococcales cyanobacterium]